MTASPALQSVGILVADAQPLFRCGLLHALAHSFAACSLHEAATAQALQQLVDSQPVRLLLLATTLPDAPGGPAGLVAALRQRQPQLAVIVIIDPATTPELTSLRLLRLHVGSLLARTATPQQVCTAVDAVLRGDHHYDDYTLELLHRQLHHRNLSREAAIFSPRQLDVLRLIAADYSTEEIAEYLCASARTIEYHRSQMLQKAGTRTSVGLVLFAQRRGLLPASGEATVRAHT